MSRCVSCTCICQQQVHNVSITCTSLPIACAEYVLVLYVIVMRKASCSDRIRSDRIGSDRIAHQETWKFCLQRPASQQTATPVHASTGCSHSVHACSNCIRVRIRVKWHNAYCTELYSNVHYMASSQVGSASGPVDLVRLM